MFSSKTQLSGEQLNQIMGLSRKFDYENEKSEKVEEPEAVRFAKWKDGNYAKDEGVYYELRPAEHKDTWNPDRGYKLSELYTKFKQEAK